MKKIEANIPTFRLVEVREALAVLGMFDFLAIDANDVAPAAGLIELHRGLEAESDLRPVLRLEILVEDDLIQPAIAAIASGLAGLRDWDLSLALTDIQSVTTIDGTRPGAVPFTA